MSQNPFILGLRPEIEDSALKSTDDLFRDVGQNTGNLAFHYAIHRQIGRPASVGWEQSAEAMSAAGPIGVIPAANQLGPHADFGGLARKFDETNLALVAIGLGAQGSLSGEIPNVPEGTLRWVRCIADRAVSEAPNISVRGSFTQKVLDHYGFEGKSVVLGCPSLFINLCPDLGYRIHQAQVPPRRIAVAAGHPQWKPLRSIEQSLARMVTATNGSYIGQATIDMVRLTRGEARTIAEAQLRDIRDYILPELGLDEFTRWADEYGAVYFNVPAWMEHYRRFDLVIGARIHGTILAMQAGVPAVCVVHDMRTLELCETMMVPYILVADYKDGISRSMLETLFEFDHEAFDNNRRLLARRYVEFLTCNGTTPAQGLVNFAEA
jgi:hypothetical protein